LAFARIYNGLGLYVTHDIGWGWTHSYSLRLALSPLGQTVSLARYDGKIFIYRYQGGVWITDADITNHLTELKDGNNVRTGWRYTVAADDSVETYTAAGKILSIAGRTGRTQTLAYDIPAASGGDDDPETLDTVTDDTGRQLVFSYDTSKRIATVTGPADGVITYGYDDQSNLVSVQYPDGRSKTYHYNEPEHTAGANLPHALTGITDENGDRYATYQYQADGKAISTGHASGADLHTLAYNLDGSTTVTDPFGTARTHSFTTILGVVKSTGQSQPGGSGCGPSSSATTYDANGNVKSRADFNGHQTCYAYDLTRNLETARVEGLAAGASCPTNLATYTPAANSAERKILTEWSTSFRLPTKITEAGRETSTVYDTRGNVTSTSIKDTTLNKARTWTTAYTYHATAPGVLVQKVDDGPRLDVTDTTTTDYYAPDENCLGGHFGCRGQVKQVTNALGHVTRYDEYDAHGHVLKIADPNGLVTTLAYTPRGWLQSRDVGGELSRFDYDNVGQLIKLTRPDASYVSFEYDPAHRLTAIVQQDGSRFTYTLDAAGNRTKEEITGVDGGYVYYTHRREFDALGRLWKDIGALNQTVTYEYDAQGNMKQIDGARTDVADLTRHDYDPLDRLTQTLNADGGIEQFTPNALDQTTKIVDPASQTTSLTVNALGDVTQTVSADTGTTERTYDEAGNLKTEKDARGVTVTYTWDVLNRMTKKQSSDPAAPVYRYTYDTCGNGRLCYVQRNGEFHLFFNYDLHGRPAYRLGAVPGSSWLYGQYFYDAYGRPSTVVYPTGRKVTFAYDAQGRISEVATQPASGSPVTVLASGFVYGYPFAGPQSFSYGNGHNFYQSRDQDYRPWFNFDGPRFKLYSHDEAGNVASLADINNTLLTYTYDATGRLTGATNTATNSFGSLAWLYDQNGNRQSETRNAGTMVYVYSPPNWLWQKGSESRTRTANGNTASISVDAAPIATFTYDGYNRLATSTTAAEVTTYTYNALGERIKKRNQNGLQTVFHYGPNGELLFEKDQAGNTKEYVWLNGRPLARIDNSTAIYYYHVDHLGTPQAMTDAAGAVKWRADYEPFGKATVKVATVENNLRLPGQYFDRETGLHYNYFRDYDPGSGRYVEADPIGLNGGMNLYTYANANPLLYVDPNGLLSLSDVATAMSDATGGCSSNSFTDDVVNNFVDVQDSTSLLKAGTSLALGGAFAKQYGGLTFGGAAMGLVKEMRSGFTVTGIGSRTFLQAAATSGATWAVNSILIKGSYDAGVLAGSVLRTALNRAASSAACTCQK
jgi:RHS repeat-associated protein